MKLKMAKNSLFAILLRSPWWVSLALAAGLSLLARLLLPERFAVAGMLGSFPFVVIAAMAASRQWRAPSASQTAQSLQQLNALKGPAFADVVEAAWQSQGYEVERLKGSGADMALSKAGRQTLLAFRRWKASNVGVEPLRELHAAQLKAEAAASICVASGVLSDNARAFAKQMDIRIVDAAELAALVRTAGVLPRI